MGTGYLPEDREGLTMPEIFSYPASPDLAARIDGRRNWPAATTRCWSKVPAA